MCRLNASWLMIKLLTALIGIVATLSLLGCRQTEPGGTFQLTAETLPGTCFYYRPFTSQVPGLMGFVTKDRLRKDRVTDGYAVLNAEPGSALSIANEWSTNPLDGSPVLALSVEEFVFETTHSSASMGEYGLVRVRSNAVSDSLVDDLSTFSDGPSSPRITYSSESGLTMIFSDNPDTFTVYQTREAPADGKKIRDVAAIGSGYLDAALVWVIVTNNGDVCSIAADEPGIQQLPQLQWLGKTWIDFIQKNHSDNVVSFVFAAGITATNSVDNVVLLDCSGNYFSLAKLNASKMDLNGRLRSEQDRQQSIEDGLYYKSDGNEAIPSRVGNTCVLIPLDQGRIAIFDRDYQRLIIAEPEVYSE